MKDEETATQLEESGEIEIKRLKFKVEKDKPKKRTSSNKFNNFNQPSTHNSFGQLQQQQQQSNNPPQPDLKTLFAQLTKTIENGKKEILEEIKKSAASTREAINKNNSNLAVAITQVINMSRKLNPREELKSSVVIDVINQCCPSVLINDEN